MAPKFLRAAKLILVLFVATGCAESDQQNEFEQQAFSVPEGITEMTVNGTAVPGAGDPDDWRISPMFAGFIEVSTPAFPNPVNLNSPLTINLDIKGIESISGLAVFVFRDPDRLVGPIYTNDQTSLSPGLETITLQPIDFSRTGNPTEVVGLNRILIFDGRENLITYGDVEVQ
ncbi:MAG: hypothetical protein R3211_12445 [Balneolaceae bacterium]|nr:hypothetical protein [Balneolaceae bacterium]